MSDALPHCRPISLQGALLLRFGFSCLGDTTFAWDEGGKQKVGGRRSLGGLAIRFRQYFLEYFRGSVGAIIGTGDSRDSRSGGAG